MSRLCAMTLLLSFSLTCWSATGSEMLQKCEKGVDSSYRATPANMMDVGYCVGYLDGLVSGWTWSTGSAPSPKFPFCEPDGVTRPQEIAVLVKFLKANPERLHLDGGALVVEALTAAFPCR